MELLGLFFKYLARQFQQSGPRPGRRVESLGPRRVVERLSFLVGQPDLQDVVSSVRRGFLGSCHDEGCIDKNIFCQPTDLTVSSFCMYTQGRINHVT